MLAADAAVLSRERFVYYFAYERKIASALVATTKILLQKH